MNTMSKWLEARLRQERLSLREAAEKTGLSHATIASIRNGNRPYPDTIIKLAKAFGGDCRLELEDHLLTLAGYRSERPDEDQSLFKVIPLLSSAHRQIIEVVVIEMARIDGI